MDLGELPEFLFISMFLLGSLILILPSASAASSTCTSNSDCGAGEVCKTAPNGYQYCAEDTSGGGSDGGSGSDNYCSSDSDCSGDEICIDQGYCVTPESETCNGVDDDYDGSRDEGDLCSVPNTCQSGSCQQRCGDEVTVNGNPVTGNVCGTDGVIVASVGSDGCTDMYESSVTCDVPNTYCSTVSEGTHQETNNGWKRTYSDYSFECKCSSGSLKT